MNVKLCEPCFAVMQKHPNMTVTRLTTLMCGSCRLRTRTAFIMNDRRVPATVERYMKRKL
jgi:hypothetical protein